MKSLALLTLGFFANLDVNLFFNEEDKVEKTNYITTEQLDYKLKIGWITLGSGQVAINYDAYRINNRNHHEVNIHAHTLGLGNWLSNLDDNYTSLVDGQNARSYSSYKDVYVQNGRWEQWNDFDYGQKKIKVKARDSRKGNTKRSWSVEMLNDTYDLLGTFMHFKNTDWERFMLNQSIMVKTFYKDRLYRVGAQYKGLERIKIGGERVFAHRLELLLPDHEDLTEEGPVVVWVSNDKNHYPLRIESKLTLGTARCELAKINGHDLDF